MVYKKRSNLSLIIHLIIAIIFFVSFFVITIYFTPADAAQIKMLEDGSEFSAEISKFDINRIKTLGDRIRSVRSNIGELELSKDDKLGEIYIRPTKNSNNRPINLFIITEQNFTYKALLYPRAIPSEQIILKNDNVVLNSDSEVARNSTNSYEQEIINLIKAMRDSRKLDGYKIKTKRKVIDFGDISLRLISRYKGDSFIGEIFTLKNSTKRIVLLKEKMFFKNGVRAIKIEKLNLLPKEVTKVLIVS